MRWLGFGCVLVGFAFATGCKDVRVEYKITVVTCIYGRFLLWIASLLTVSPSYHNPALYPNAFTVSPVPPKYPVDQAHHKPSSGTGNSWEFECLNPEDINVF